MTGQIPEFGLSSIDTTFEVNKASPRKLKSHCLCVPMGGSCSNVPLPGDMVYDPVKPLVKKLRNSSYSKEENGQSRILASSKSFTSSSIDSSPRNKVSYRGALTDVVLLRSCGDTYTYTYPSERDGSWA